MTSFFSDPLAQEAVEHLYQHKLDELPISYELLQIETSFGNTNIILTGQETNPPLVLLHGSNACAPLAIEALIGLVDHFRIYAIDIVGQPNLSEAFRPSMKDDSYAQWMYEILTRLNIWKATLVGISFGGFISWKTLTFDEKRIARAFLITPVGIINSPILSLVWKVFLPIKLYQWQKNEEYIRRFLEELFTEPDEFAHAFLSKVLLYFDMDFSPIPTIPPNAAKSIQTPIHLIAAEHDLLIPIAPFFERAKSIFPSLSQCLTLPSSKHVPDQKGNERIVEFIKELVLK